MESAEYKALYELEEGMWWFVGMRRIVDTLLAGRLRQGWRCLEAGCGTGFNALDFAARYGWQVFPCDYEWEALRFSAARGVPRMVRADVAQLPYAAASFDCLTSLDVLVCLDPPLARQAMQEFYRVLRPGGLALIRVAALEALRGRHSDLVYERRRFSLEELTSELRSAGFRVLRATYLNSMLMPVAWLRRRVLQPLRLAGSDSEVRPFPPWLDWLFLQALLLEDRWLAMGRSLPAGVSAIALAEK